MAVLQPIIVFHGRHFVRYLGICYRICVKLLQLTCAVITHNSVKKNEVSVVIDGWVTAKYSVSLPPFYPPSWNLKSHLCKTLTGYVRCYSEQFNKTTSLSQTVFMRSTNAAYTYTQTHTQTHDDSRRRNAIRCISPKNGRLMKRGKCITCGKTKTEFVNRGAADGSFLNTQRNSVNHWLENFKEGESTWTVSMNFRLLI